MNNFDLNEFRRQIAQMKNLGSIQHLMNGLPGMDQTGMGSLGGVDADEEVTRIAGIIDSMTSNERRDPSLVDISRRRRIAAGSGVEPDDLRGLVNQFTAMADFVRRIEKRRKSRF